MKEIFFSVRAFINKKTPGNADRKLLGVSFLLKKTPGLAFQYECVCIKVFFLYFTHSSQSQRKIILFDTPRSFF